MLNNIKQKIEPICRIGWRPYTSDLPQQSLVSYKKAYEEGHRILLCDIRITADGYMVCCHDDDISKVKAFSPEGKLLSTKISETKLNELLTYDFGRHKNIYGLKILRIEEFLKFCATYPDITPCLELKVPLDCVNQSYLVSIITKFGFENNIMFISSKDEASVFGDLLPNSIIGKWVYSITNKTINEVAQYKSKGKFIHVAKEGFDERCINLDNYLKCKSKGIDIGFSFIPSSAKEYFQDLKKQGIFNYCKYISIDEISWLKE